MSLNTTELPAPSVTTEMCASSHVPTAPQTGPYRLKTSSLSSHGRILFYLSSQPRSIRILDVGTSHGYLGGALRQLGFTNVVGLEQDPASAQVAQALYTRVIRHNLDDLTGWSNGEKYDVIICADILEHLRDPWEALKQFVDSLALNGKLVISLPNSGHWWIRLNVLLGRFPMQERGLFDKGHLRFFTWFTMQSLIRQANLEIEETWVTPIPFTLVLEGPVGKQIARAAESAYHLLARSWKRLFAYQFVVATARRSM